MTTELRPPVERFELTIQAGDDRPPVVPVLDDNGAARDLTGWSARATVRARVRSTETLHVWDTATATAECGPTGVTLLVDSSRAWSWRYGRFDLVVTDPYGASRVERSGVVRVVPLISR